MQHFYSDVMNHKSEAFKIKILYKFMRLFVQGIHSDFFLLKMPILFYLIRCMILTLRSEVTFQYVSLNCLIFSFIISIL